MTKAEFHSCRLDAQSEPTDEQPGQLMENAVEKVKETNRESDEKSFEERRKASDEAKLCGADKSQGI